MFCLRVDLSEFGETFGGGAASASRRGGREEWGEEKTIS